MKKIYLIAAVVALAAGVATYFFANELKTSKVVTGVDHATVLIANADIDVNTILTKDMFTETKVPVDSVISGAVTKAEQVEGYMTTQKIFSGEQLMSQKLVLVGAGESNDKLSYQLENGMYAYSIYVKEENAVSYYIQKGDRINIYNDALPSVEPVFKNIEVIRVGEYFTGESEEVSAAYAVLTLALTKEQIPKMMELEDPDQNSDVMFRIVLVPHSEGLGLGVEEETDTQKNESTSQPENEEEETLLTPAEPAA